MRLPPNSSDNMSDTEPEYEVERIIGRKLRADGKYYQVKWGGYPLSECTWEHQSSLTHCQQAIQLFECHYRRENGLTGSTSPTLDSDGLPPEPLLLLKEAQSFAGRVDKAPNESSRELLQQALSKLNRSNLEQSGSSQQERFREHRVTKVLGRERDPQGRVRIQVQWDTGDATWEPLANATYFSAEFEKYEHQCYVTDYTLSGRRLKNQDTAPSRPLNRHSLRPLTPRNPLPGSSSSSPPPKPPKTLPTPTGPTNATSNPSPKPKPTSRQLLAGPHQSPPTPQPQTTVAAAPAPNQLPSKLTPEKPGISSPHRSSPHGPEVTIEVPMPQGNAVTSPDPKATLSVSQAPIPSPQSTPAKQPVPKPSPILQRALSNSPLPVDFEPDAPLGVPLLQPVVWIGDSDDESKPTDLIRNPIKEIPGWQSTLSLKYKYRGQVFLGPQVSHRSPTPSPPIQPCRLRAKIIVIDSDGDSDGDSDESNSTRSGPPRPLKLNGDSTPTAVQKALPVTQPSRPNNTIPLRPWVKLTQQMQHSLYRRGLQQRSCILCAKPDDDHGGGSHRSGVKQFIACQTCTGLYHPDCAHAWLEYLGREHGDSPDTPPSESSLWAELRTVLDNDLAQVTPGISTTTPVALQMALWPSCWFCKGGFGEIKRLLKYTHDIGGYPPGKGPSPTPAPWVLVWLENQSLREATWLPFGWVEHRAPYKAKGLLRRDPTPTSSVAKAWHRHFESPVVVQARPEAWRELPAHGLHLGSLLSGHTNQQENSNLRKALKAGVFPPETARDLLTHCPAYCCLAHAFGQRAFLTMVHQMARYEPAPSFVATATHPPESFGSVEVASTIGPMVYMAADPGCGTWLRQLNQAPDQFLIDRILDLRVEYRALDEAPSKRIVLKQIYVRWQGQPYEQGKYLLI
ncbi:hypothetical protein BJ085DRAFT_41257 [Dimargaris cristalligena]|uniref:Chromo domain-containing protein n=1 Tax=Dimargaris cristalligena TaxID=215637 RepID=A0A4P9ZKN2_9FUNG|nr:hypothetical protein BJ085DRAFT_41257 [Dimargaris cristalligena]|eukprot:RKP33618.1 hypothetical protein BJ085DRAFT_41257 [Dimargaris cristalligena]